jgi:hypothetical protein
VSSLEQWQRAALRRATVPAILAVAGIVLLLVAGDGVGAIVGWGIVGIAATLALSLAFLEVGYSEDRARARGEPQAYDRPGETPPRPRPMPSAHPPARGRRPRSGRRRRGSE